MNETEVKVEGIEVEKKKWKLDKETVHRYLKRAEHGLAVIGGMTLLALVTGRLNIVILNAKFR